MPENRSNPPRRKISNPNHFPGGIPERPAGVGIKTEATPAPGGLLVIPGTHLDKRVIECLFSRNSASGIHREAACDEVCRLGVEARKGCGVILQRNSDKLVAQPDFRVLTFQNF